MMEFPINFKSNPAKAERFVQFVSFGIRFKKAIIATMNDGNFAPKMEVVTDKEKNQSDIRVK